MVRDNASCCESCRGCNCPAKEMRALTFKEFQEDCPAKESCVKECNIGNAMCQHLYKEAIAPHLAEQMRAEAKKKKKDGIPK
jgi:hypothetical protein